ncbi:signal peptide protein [Clostridium perfringens]|uniref:signal peptide protein n=1 Tax=Clostridium perfringens TaxID=1502 RepID=UPI003747D350
MKNLNVRRIFLLLLVIGITGSLGSVSYFSDKENVNGDLRLTLGTLSSEATKTVKIEKMDIEVPVSDTFIITNNGTLDQRMTLNFKNSSIGNDGLEKIKYSLTLNMQRDMPENYSNAEFKFDLNIGYTQENSK